MDHPVTPVRTYRLAFVVTLVVAIGFAIGVAALWWRLHTQSPMPVPQATASTAASEPPISGASADAAAPGASEAPLVPIQLSPERMQSIGVQIGQVKYQPVSDALRVDGNIQANERRLAYVQTRVAGWIRDVFVDATGDAVRQGQPLFTIYSPDLVTTEEEYLLAKKTAADVQQSTVTGVASGAQSLVRSARERLLQWQISPGDIAKLDAAGQVVTNLTIDAPASGYIIEKNALPNMYVQPETRLYTIADLSEVWVIAQVFQNDAGKIKPGDRADVTVDTYPGSRFQGRVDYLLPQVDLATRTLPVRLVIANPGLKLRPGMYVNVGITLPMGRQLVVPASAVFHSGTRTLIFGYRGAGQIEPRDVELGARVGDDQILLKGAQADEQIVTSANFLIDSEAQLQAAAGAFAPPPPGAGQAAAINMHAQGQGTVDITTDPSPPRKGRNTIRVRLAAADGRAIPGAQVTVTFFMAAMPAMGMSAMKTVITAIDKGGGLYEGTGDLGSGGTFQVTVTATQNGRTVATRQLSMTATGGM